MTSKEKARELVDSMGFSTSRSFNSETGEYHHLYRNQYAKECALITVNVILNDLNESLEIAEDLHSHAKGLVMGSLVSWQEVKKEIEKL